jgi:hypothetical protein
MDDTHKTLRVAHDPRLNESDAEAGSSGLYNTSRWDHIGFSSEGGGSKNRAIGGTRADMRWSGNHLAPTHANRFAA